MNHNVLLPLPPVERIRELFYYEDGCLYYKESRGNRRAGDEAGCYNKEGYRSVSVDGKRYQSHRIIWKYHNGVDPSGEIDHDNNNPSDNRIENLIDCTHAENMSNNAEAQEWGGSITEIRNGSVYLSSRGLERKRQRGRDNGAVPYVDRFYYLFIRNKVVRVSAVLLTAWCKQNGYDRRTINRLCNEEVPYHKDIYRAERRDKDRQR